MITPTPEQQAIIDYPLRPLRIAAGAGTGKTSTIVMRLAAAVESGVAPESAIGITFTNKAAEELSDRLRERLPALSRVGREIAVSTYHGFAFQMLQEFGAFVGIERGTTVIGAGFQRQLLEESLSLHTYDHIDLTAPNRRVGDAATLARQLGENLLAPSDLEDTVSSGRRDGEAGVQAGRRELAAIVATYTSQKTRLGVLDYTDLVPLAHRLVTEHPEIAARIRGRYETVVVDEYQDTDPGQRLLLQAVFGDGFPLTAVGDEDQTIYTWRGASVVNFERFPTHFPADDGSAAGTLRLTLNRRSGSAILAFANVLRAKLHDDSDKLHPLPDAPVGSVAVSWHRTTTDEASFIADEIRRRHDEANLAWSDIAVLFRKNHNIAPVREALSAVEIPVDVVSLGGLLSVPEVAELRAWLRVLADPTDSASLVRILLGGRFRLGMGDLAPFVAANRPNGEDVVLLESLQRVAADAPDGIDGLTPESDRRLLEFVELYRELLVVAQGVTLSELCRRILDVLNFWAEVDAMPNHAALSTRLNLYRFLDRAESWSPLEGRPSLRAFLGYLDLLEDETAADELDTASVASEDAVSLMTVHRAKGLEWDTVFLPALTRGTFPASSRGFDNPVDYPQFVPYELRIDRESLPDLSSAASLKERRALLAAHHDEQEWRTAYVAVTRARRSLYVSGAFWSDATRPRPPSALWDLADGLEGSIRATFVAEPGDRPDDGSALTPAPAPDPLFGDGGWTAALRGRRDDDQWVARNHPENAASVADHAAQLVLDLEGLPSPPQPEEDPTVRTSVTGLVTLATCPLRFKFSELDRLPRRPDRSLRFGTNFHRKVELHNLGVVPLDDKNSDLYDLGDAEASGAGTAAFDRFTSSRFAEPRPRYVEVPIELRLEDARVRGRVDAVYQTGASWEIVDYKSGRKTDEQNRIVQLQAYAVAAMEGAIADPIPNSIEVTFAYFGSRGVDESKWVADAVFLERARERLHGLITIAQTEAFEPTPSPACRTCDFTRFCEAGKAWLAES